MEGINNQESFESFKNIIAETFKTEGLSEGLKSEIERWYEKRFKETDDPNVDVTAVQKASFQLELAQIYIVTYQDDLANEVLDIVFLFIKLEIDRYVEELDKATENPDLWVKKMKEKRPEKIIVSTEDEIQKVKDDLEKLESLLVEIDNLFLS